MNGIVEVMLLSREENTVAEQSLFVFPVGEPNTAFAQYFIGQSYLAPLTLEPMKRAIPFDLRYGLYNAILISCLSVRQIGFRQTPATWEARPALRRSQQPPRA